jgi:Ran GTPase-activating protein 1
MDAAKARYLAGALLDGSRAHYTKARLGTWAHCEESMEVFGEALARCPNLTSVDLGDIVASRMEAEAVKTYTMLADKLAVHRGKLKALDFSYNAVGPTGLKALRGLLEEQESLEDLIMVACGVSAETQDDLTDILLFRDRAAAGSASGSGAAAMTRLRRVVFDNNLAGEGGAKAMGRVLRQSPDLEEFQFSGARVPKEGGRALIASLLALPRTKLTRLDLHDNIFGSYCGTELAELVSVPITPNLEDLDLSYLGIGDDETAHLCRCLIGATEGSAVVEGSAARRATLRRLKLTCNDLEQDGATAPMLATLLVALTGLEELHVEDNELGSAVRWVAKGLLARAKVAGARPLQVVNLASNMAHTKALQAVVEAANAMPEGALKAVEIGGNFVDEDVAAGWTTDSVKVTSALAELEPADEEEEAEAESGFAGCDDEPIPLLGETVDDLADAVAGMKL